jgi:hypothetical protein
MVRRGICVISTECILHKIIAEVKTSSCCVCTTMRKKIEDLLLSINASF